MEDTNTEPISRPQRWPRTASMLGFWLTIGSVSAWLMMGRPIVLLLMLVGWFGTVLALWGTSKLATHQPRSNDLYLPFVMGWSGGLVGFGLICTAGFVVLGGKPGLLILVFVFHVPELCRSIWMWRGGQQTASERRHGRKRLNSSQVTGHLLGHLPLVLMLACSWAMPLDDGVLWAAKDIGLEPAWPASLSLCVGACCIVPYRIARDLVHRVRWMVSTTQQFQDFYVDSCVVHLAQHVPRGKTAGRLSQLDTVFVSPILEEIAYRGFFVYFLAQLVNSIPIAIGIGALLFLTMHLYQGLQLLPEGLLFYAWLVGLLYSPAGLVGAIGLHIAWNAYFRLSLPRSAHDYRETRRRLQSWIRDSSPEKE